MRIIEIRANDAGQRLDRFVRKYLPGAPLSMIYRIVRKDVKLNGKRDPGETMLHAGDRIFLYVSDDTLNSFLRPERTIRVRKQFSVVYEDENILLVNKPFGLLTHGDRKEKKNHLTNQVIAWLQTEGAYRPDRNQSFVPAPANRLDRNTTGLVLFGKNAEALRELNRMMRTEGAVYKEYLAIVEGTIEETAVYRGSLLKDTATNRTKVLGLAAQEDARAKRAETIVHLLTGGKGVSLVSVRLITGRSHQIRAHLAAAGHPLLGDPKYGKNRPAKRETGFAGAKKARENKAAGAQMLHAYSLSFHKCEDRFAYLDGKVFYAPPPAYFTEAVRKYFGREGLLLMQEEIHDEGIDRHD